MDGQPLSEEGPLAPRRPELRPDPNAPQLYATRRVVPVSAEPRHLPGAPERLLRQAVRLERRSAWTMLLAPPLVVATFSVNPFGLIGVLMGLLANLVAIGAAYRNRTRVARDASGFAVLAYTTGSFLHAMAAPWVLLAFAPLGFAVRWLGQAADLRREAWRVTYAGRRLTDEQARKRREQALRRHPGPREDDPTEA